MSQLMGLPPVTLDEILDEVRQLPSLPAIVTELIATLDNEDTDIERLAGGIAKDQALAARALRVANSPFYGMQSRVETIHDAILVLGFRAVVNLVTTASLSGFFKPVAESGFDLTRFWRHGIGVALAGRALAGKAGLSGERCFTAGLLHDIGRLLLATTRPHHYAAVLDWRSRTDAYLVEAERHCLGLDHVQAGEALARRWRLPEDICLAVAAHHEPTNAPTSGLADVIHVADALAHALDLAGDPQALVPPVRRESWRRLGLDQTPMTPLLSTIEQEHEGYCALLSR